MDVRVETAVRIMHQKKQDGVQITELARRVNLSTCRFTHLFTTELSVSPKRYLRNIKMDAAKTLLKESFLSIKEIASSVGFGDRSHFSREFKKAFGHGPSEFRARHRSSLENNHKAV